jgi:RNA polymerase sigma-70 factor (ECF subfamily)
MPGSADTGAIEMLYRRYGAALVLFAAAITGERGRAQDAVHQVFLRLLERGGLDRVADPKAYLFVSVRNVILNDLRARERHVSIENESIWFDPPNRDHAAEFNLRRALGELSEDQRQVTVLHIWGELTFAQIADVLGVSTNTVSSRYRYALAKLRETLCFREEPCANS